MCMKVKILWLIDRIANSYANELSIEILYQEKKMENISKY